MNANRIDPEQPQALAGYYRTYRLTNETPPEDAIIALEAAFTAAPFDAQIRRVLGHLLLWENKDTQARTVLGPLAYRPHGNAEARKLRQLLAGLDRGERQPLIDELAPLEKRIAAHTGLPSRQLGHGMRRMGTRMGRSKMLTVHHLRISQSERIVWLCEELGLDYELKLYTRRTDNNLAPDEYKALHPMGIAPVITDGDLVLGESGAICEYIDRKYGAARLSPGPDHPDFAGHLFWFHFSNATFMTNGMMALVARRAGVDPLPDFVADRVAKAWALAEARLGEAEFFGGSQLTTADIMMGFNLTTSRAFGGASLDPFPNIAAYLKRIGERPAYRRAMEKCEPGMTPKLD